MKRLLLVSLVATLVIGGWWAWRHPAQVPLIGAALAPSWTLLAVGTDEGNRTDAILLVYVNPSGVRVLTLPRDTYCSGGRKLNALYKRAGADGFRRVCAQLVGHPIEHCLVVPLPKLRSYLTTVFPAGLTVRVPGALRYADKAAGFSYSIPAGEQRLTGRQLEWYLRDRYSDDKGRGELARAERWKLFLRAAVTELRRPQNLARLPEIVRATQQTLPISMTTKDVVGLAGALLRHGEVSYAYLPGRPIRLGRALFVQLDKEAVRRQAALARRGIVLPPELTVLVLNGTTQAGLARSVARRLEREIGAHCQSGNAATAFESRTTVSFGDARQAPLARELASELSARVVHDPEAGAQKQFLTVILGGNYLRRVARKEAPTCG
jgi:LCP family protein required for cell wall assembly